MSEKGIYQAPELGRRRHGGKPSSRPYSGLTSCAVFVDEPPMRKHALGSSDGEKARPVESGEPAGLSARIRELILGFKVDERRKRDDGNGAGASGNRRRRGDDTSVASGDES